MGLIRMTVGLVRHSYQKIKVNEVRLTMYGHFHFMF